MAMMKLRDDADRKSLARLGLMEPDDSAKALELGFPRHNNPLQQYDSVLMDAPVPMSLPDLAPLEASVFMKREASEKFFIIYKTYIVITCTYCFLLSSSVYTDF